MPDTRPTLASVLMMFSEQLEDLVANTAGYRERLERAGFSPTMAEMMAAAYHNHVMDMIFKGVKKDG